MHGLRSGVAAALTLVGLLASTAVLAEDVTLTVSRWAGPQADAQQKLLDEYSKASGVTVKLDAIDYGQLDVVLLYPRRFLSWIPLVVRVLTRREERAGESVARFTGRTVVVRASHEVPRQLDGDTIGPGCELHMECIHGRLLVRVPR